MATTINRTAATIRSNNLGASEIMAGVGKESQCGCKAQVDLVPEDRPPWDEEHGRGTEISLAT